MDRNQLKPCGFFFLIYRFLTCWFWVVVHMLCHSNVPGFIIFFEASFSTTKNHSIVWDQNHFIVELFFFVRCWINAMSSMDISVLISSKIHPLYSNHSSLKTDVKVFLSRAEIFLPYQPFDNWKGIQTFHPLEQMSRFLCQGKIGRISVFTFIFYWQPFDSLSTQPTGFCHSFTWLLKKSFWSIPNQVQTIPWICHYSLSAKA